MIGNFNDVKESQMNRFVESPLGKKAESSVADIVGHSDEQYRGNSWWSANY